MEKAIHDSLDEQILHKLRQDLSTNALQVVPLYEEITAPLDGANTASNNAADAVVYTAQDSTGKARDIVIIQNKKGKVKELYVDGKRIPNRYIDDYKELVDQRLQAIENAPRANRQEVKVQMEQARAAATDAQHSIRKNHVYSYNYSYGDSLVSPPPVPPAPPAPPTPSTAPLPVVPPVPPVPPLDNDSEARKAYEQELKENESEMKAYGQELEAYKEEMRAYEEELRTNGPLNEQQQKELVNRQKEWAQQVAHMQEMSQHQAEMVRHQAELAKQHQKVAQKHQQQFEKVKDELVKDGIIKKGDENLNIQLNNRAFYINGKKQPQQVYEKYKKLMNIEANDSSNLNFQYNSN